MLLTSTVAYEGMPKVRGLSVKGIAILVAGLFLGAAIGFAIASFTSTTDAPTASAVVVEPRAVDPHFLEMNVGSFEGLEPAASAAVVEPRAVDPHFLEANVGSLEYPGLGYTEPSSGPR